MLKINDTLSSEEIIKNLKAKDFYDITLLEKTGSTNDDLKKLASFGENEGKVIISKSQTGGRGRFSRKFHSPDNSGIYMSILLKPNLPAESSVLITTAAAVAICEACEKNGSEPAKIKWVNDIFVNSKKAGGILTEASINTKTGRFNWVVLGIGINVYENENGFDDEIKNIATCIFKNQKQNLKNNLISDILNNFLFYYENLSEKTFLKKYIERSIVIGKTVTVLSDKEERAAKVLDIDKNCRLIVEFDDTTKAKLNSGEISLRL